MTSKLTREELRKRAKENINNLRFASKQRAFESARKEILADLQLAEYALEAMESEPYGFTEGERFGMVLEPRQWPAPKDGEPQLHIKEQPGPDIDTLRHAFETEEREETGGFNLHKSGIDYVDKSTQAQWEAWLVCRAAMLQAGNSPVIPDGSASMLRRWLVFGRGMQNAGSQLPHNLIAETEEMLAAADCSIPMISDRWVPVSERMPEDRTQVILWDSEIGEVTSGHYSHKTHTFYHCGDAIQNEITHWMPPPAAPQEAKDDINALIPLVSRNEPEVKGE